MPKKFYFSNLLPPSPQASPEVIISVDPTMPSNNQEDPDGSISLVSAASLQSYAHSEFESDHSFAHSENIKLSSRKNNVLDTPENRLVWWSKLLVFLVMILSAITSCMAAYLFTKQEERQDFEDAVRKFYFEG